ncbi:MAG: DNA polymerase IV [Alteromonadaceae bacterium]|nr:DNA polymerase IV [Alteromonadaceae bacterium]
MTERPRKIIHVDCDAFYASLEIREQPELARLPIAVGGSADRRGVIATCNYEARRYGIHSAMASATAMRLCPDLRILPPRFDLYRAVSLQMREIFADYTEVIEPLSLDEAFLDVSESDACQGSATLMARQIRQRVRQELGITVSAGVAPNKFLAKVASDWNKPDGLMVLTPDEVADFVKRLPVSKINGVGKVTAAKLANLGVESCGDLQGLPQELLLSRFGKQGLRLYHLARGEDQRAVQPERVRKSLSVEQTYDVDLANLAEVTRALPGLLDELRTRFGRKVDDDGAVAKRFVKVKFSDFTQTTLEQTLSGTHQGWDSLADYQRLMNAAWKRGAKPARLLGVGIRFRDDLADSAAQRQLLLFGPDY